MTMFVAGQLVGKGDGIEDVSVIHAPFSLWPTPFPRPSCEHVQRSMPLFSSLVHQVSENTEYLQRTLRPAAQHDSFTAKLLSILADGGSNSKQSTSKISLGLHRSDYMLDEPSNTLLQVELNTVAVSMGSLSTRVSAMHRHLLQLYPSHAPCTLEQLPDHNPLAGYAAALAATQKAHCEQHNLANTAAVVFVVQPGERNAYDQHLLQQCLWTEHSVHAVRRTLHDVSTRGEIDSSGTLRLDGFAVSVFYLRAGYTPDDYPSDAEWDARRLMERCNAVSCPSVAYQLVGAKKIQQDLAVPGRLQEFMGDTEEARALQKCFAGLWSLDDPSASETKDIIAQAIRDPEKYILKPQREGGGNNLYGQDMVTKLQKGGDMLASYILMQRILPPILPCTMVRQGKSSDEDAVSELGIYGTYVRIGDKVHMNECVGHVLRTKAAASNEGGVAAGFAVLDSPYFE